MTNAMILAPEGARISSAESKRRADIMLSYDRRLLRQQSRKRGAVVNSMVPADLLEEVKRHQWWIEHHWRPGTGCSFAAALLDIIETGLEAKRQQQEDGQLPPSIEVEGAVRWSSGAC